MSNALKTLELLVEELDISPLDDADRGLFLFAKQSAILRKQFRLIHWHPHKDQYEALEAAGLEVSEHLPEKASLVFLLPGKSKEETLFTFAKAAMLVSDGGWIVVSMENKLGAGRFEKAFAELFGSVDTLSKNRCRAFAAQKGEALNQDLLEGYLKLGEKTISDEKFHTVPGVFSESAIDEGSALLAQHMPKSFRGCVADFGAGWGYLSAQVLKAKGKLRELHLFELDKRALACAEMNVRSENTKVHFHWHDVTKRVDQKFDTILMNPPFHQGKQMTVGLGKDFIVSAAQAVKPQGELWMVANRQLPYEKHLEESGLRWRIVDQGPRYKIIHARKVAHL